MYFAGTFVDDGPSTVAQIALHIVFVRVAIRSVYLDSFVSSLERLVRGVPLSHRSLTGIALSFILQPA